LKALPVRPNEVQVVSAIIRQIVIEFMGDQRDMQTTFGEIGGNQNNLHCPYRNYREYANVFSALRRQSASQRGDHHRVAK
jgi:hypothetical protein